MKVDESMFTIRITPSDIWDVSRNNTIKVRESFQCSANIMAFKSNRNST
ncbi:hypothetical protein [Flavobacterium ammonificans]|jgi:hypothetical protein|nr:hypothetical protein [Flavobacterium ammonificans]